MQGCDEEREIVDMRDVESGLVFSAAACAICCMSIFRICVPFFRIRIQIGALLGIADIMWDVRLAAPISDGGP